VGLRGYAQQDPLNEFRREAFQLYGELRDLIRHQVATSIFRVTITRQPPPGASALNQSLAAGMQRLTGTAGAGAAAAGASGTPAATPAGGTATAVRPASKPVGPVVSGGLAADPMARALPTAGNGAGAAGAQARPGYTPTGERIGRNDACWCGSGKKYKKCHGQ
jgi:preprotein translocase subunit SecA